MLVHASRVGRFSFPMGKHVERLSRNSRLEKDGQIGYDRENSGEEVRICAATSDMIACPRRG